jgi:hypothetical protein
MTNDISFEEISYDLAYHGSDRALELAIIETIQRLPQEVARFALDQCRFLSVGETSFGTTLPGRIASDWQGSTENMWLLLLAEGMPGDDIHSVVAHEIGHAWLKHDRLSPNVPDDCEIQTANLVRDWGFTGKGANADYCHIDIHQPSSG